MKHRVSRPVFVWVAVDAHTWQPVWFGVSLTD